MLGEIAIAADMIGMMMRVEYCRQREFFAREVFEHGGRVARINHHRAAGLAYAPDVIVAKRAYGNHFKHDER